MSNLESSSGNSWKDLAEAKRQRLASNIPQQWQLSQKTVDDTAIINVVEFIDEKCSQENNRIVDSSLHELIQSISSGKYTSEQVFSAFAERACYAQQLTNCLSEMFFELGFAKAKALDEHLARTGRTVGPLHGIPISLKDSFNIENIQTCYGIVGEAVKDTVKIEDQTELVDMLVDMGAILFVKTAVPFAVAGFETNSNLIGYTRNAVNREFSAGGSSGGEGALVAAKGSALGFGTDLCGSVRQPAAFEGIYGFKPTSSRFPRGRIYDGFYQFHDFPASVGILAKRLEDVQLMSRLIVEKQPWKVDPYASLQPWNDSTELQSLTAGILFYDGNCMPTPPILRALGIVEEALKKSGHKVFDWKFTDKDIEMQQIGNTIVGAEAGNFVFQAAALSGEPIPVTVGGYSSLNPEAKPMSAITMRELSIEIFEAKKRWLQYWKETGADILICPTVERNAVKPEKFYDDNPQSYTIFANLLDYPAVSIPLGVADRKKDKDWNYKPEPGNSYDEKNYELYDANEVDSMPIAVQIIAPRLQEEKLLHAVEIIERALKASRTA